jgi:thiol-disulfide isomerase/thioredoxin
MKLLVCVLLLLLLTSCGYRTVPVYFSADASVFTDTLSPVQRVTFQKVMALGYPCLDVVELQPGKEVQASIDRPTIFQKEYRSFLVYPKDHIFITASASNDFIPTFSTLNKNEVRDRELSVIKTFENLEKLPVVPILADYDYASIMNMEKALKSRIAPAERKSQALFDSLCNAYGVSQKFRKLTKDFVRNRYDDAILGVYAVYRDTLQARGDYWPKLRALLPQVNGLTKLSQFNANVAEYTNSLYTYLFPFNGIRNMVGRGQFEACFDSISVTFNGPARDYLLSRLMYQAFVQGYPIPASYRKQYRRYSMNKDYRKILAWAGRVKKPIHKDSPILPNDLLMVDGKTALKLEDVLAQHKGKYVLVDLWASWCVPCLEEMPAWRDLQKKYPTDKVVFLSISLDSSVPAWQSRISQLQGDSLNNYLLVHKDNAGLVRQLQINAIPRYLLYDKSGNIIHHDAPAPRDPELEKLLNQHLLK